MSRTATKASRKITKTHKTPKQPVTREYSGAPLTATKVYSRQMTEFKKTTADCMLLIDEVHGTYTFANLYRGGILPASYDATYQLTEKTKTKIARKIEDQGYQEIEVTDWPHWIRSAGSPAKRKAASK